ncbi:hypothetical protein BCT90_22975 [Vibrio lentus]|uniref:Uncharacterized protein n=1 Tax=Vibrio lentus TaxID=136468 RepID=A0A1B9QGY0_9VIBR|nr:hypothetical protein A6E08_15665 [Vibrio lentus]PME55354.1 hypothetical protein BCV34_20600 [Vibrio lentus]PME69951.1 hypothetical protein BCV30_22645 [Vibrio lentus]PME80697.1 hypothetical protein BCV27_02440 [Vibrio lentus]PMH93082.1 hypothetical protein BCU56_06175 [Vibrio lentus]
MNFDGYFEKIQIQIEKVDSLEDLLIWRKRINIGHSGLSFRTKRGRLVPHCYRRFKYEGASNALRAGSHFVNKYDLILPNP